MSINKKLLTSFFILVLLASAGGVYSFLILIKASGYISSKESVYNALLLLDEARNAEKSFLMGGRKDDDFLEDGDSELTRLHASLIDSVKILCNSLKAHEVIGENGLEPEAYRILDVVSAYENSFEDLTVLLFERGFKDYGLEGAMRDNVHMLQECKSAEEKVFAFSLRRHEKDFMLRKDIKYFEKLRETTLEFIYFIEGSKMPHMTPEYKSRVIAVTEDYLRKFEKLVMIEEAIGLDEDKGLQGKLNASANAIKPAVYSLLTQVEKKNAELQQKATLILVISIFIPLVAGFVISIVLTRKIASPISSLNKIIKNIIKGKRNELRKLDKITNRDEIGELAKNFKQMMSMINNHLKEISEKNAQLEETSKEEQKRKWAAEGLAKFSDLMKNFDDDDLKEYSYKIVSEIVKYVKANQGGIFFVNDSENPTKMIQYASYAYNRRKFVEKEVLKGEGIIGAVWLEREYTLMTDIPENYVSITSGIGEATPGALLVMPILHEDSVLGVVEIASFKNFEGFEIEFLKKVVERIGATYFSIATQERTRILLEQTQRQAESMRAQEEELRQNMEELHSTQEEMFRKQTESETVTKMLDNIINMVPYPIFVKDDQFKYLLVNRAEATLYNTTAENMLNKDDAYFIKGIKELREIRHSDRTVIDTGREYKIPEQVISFPNGTARILQTIKVPFENPLTGKLNILGVSIDVTDVRNVQEELEFAQNELQKTREMISDLQQRTSNNKRDVEMLQ